MVGFDFSVAEPKVFFFGYLTSDVFVAAAATWEDLHWTGVQKGGITHTLGTQNIYINTTGLYLVSLHVVYSCTAENHRLLLRTRYTVSGGATINATPLRGAAGSTDATAASTVSFPAKLYNFTKGGLIVFQAYHADVLDTSLAYKDLYTSCTIVLVRRGL